MLKHFHQQLYSTLQFLLVLKYTLEELNEPVCIGVYGQWLIGDENTALNWHSSSICTQNDNTQIIPVDCFIPSFNVTTEFSLFFVYSGSKLKARMISRLRVTYCQHYTLIDGFMWICYLSALFYLLLSMSTQFQCSVLWYLISA